ncbi:MAG TPA: endolytic transglycosylase MltG [Ruminococcaceae bacterium]|nr:endolytic transglycosylase MltG [Oscillospiraceae bacterium]
MDKNNSGGSPENNKNPLKSKKPFSSASNSGEIDVLLRDIPNAEQTSAFQDEYSHTAKKESTRRRSPDRPPYRGGASGKTTEKPYSAHGDKSVDRFSDISSSGKSGAEKPPATQRSKSDRPVRSTAEPGGHSKKPKQERFTSVKAPAKPSSDTAEQEALTSIDDNYIIENTEPDQGEVVYSKVAMPSKNADGNSMPLRKPLPARRTRKKRLKKKRSGCLSTFLWLCGIGVVSVVIAIVVLVAFLDFTGIHFGTGPDSLEDQEIELVLTQGMDLSDIAVLLREQEVIRSEMLFKLYAELKDSEKDFKTGVHTINRNAGYSGILSELQTKAISSKEVSVTLVERWNVREIVAELVEKNVCTEKAFMEAMQNSTFDYDFIEDIPTDEVYYRLEGYLFPDTYFFYEDIVDEENDDEEDRTAAAERAIKKMLSNFNNKWLEEYTERAKELDMTMHEVVTMASIIELEANGFYSEMKNVSAVFYNRLNWIDQPARMGSTPTAEYYGGPHYDTNEIEGLPPGPLCSPSQAAIEAALYPTEDFSANYFVTDVNMKFYYTDTLDEHNTLIQQLTDEGLWAE